MPHFVLCDPQHNIQQAKHVTMEGEGKKEQGQGTSRQYKNSQHDSLTAQSNGNIGAKPWDHNRNKEWKKKEMSKTGHDRITMRVSGQGAATG